MHTISVARQQETSRLKAHHTHDLRTLLIPWLQFRAKITYKSSTDYRVSTPVTRTNYGDEHDVTYTQLLHGYKNEIILDRKRGFDALVHRIENTIKGKFVEAKIYGRSDLKDPGFGILHRVYNHKGVCERKDDPNFIAMVPLKILHCKIERGCVIPHEPTIITSSQLHTGSSGIIIPT